MRAGFTSSQDDCSVGMAPRREALTVKLVLHCWLVGRQAEYVCYVELRAYEAQTHMKNLSNKSGKIDTVDSGSEFYIIPRWLA